MKKLLFMMLTCAAVFACQNKEDFTPTQQNQIPVFEGDEAWMIVRLADVNNLNSKALGGFEDAADNGNFLEGKVKSAHFYFYDANEAYVSEASVWKDGSAADPANDNIEFTSKKMVVLKGLTQKNYPSYMVTVLNKTPEFQPKATLDEMEKALSYKESKVVKNEPASNSVWTTVEGKNYFTMSTSSYAAEGSTVPYFVNQLSEDNFKAEPIPADLDAENPDVIPVTVYVERLAAKVTLATSMTGEKVSLEGKVKEMYPLTVTLAGDPNNLGSEDNADMGVETVYVDFTGWALNATAKNSYMSKNIDATWNFEWWNDATNHRSYWGKSYNYAVAQKYHSEASPYDGTDAFPLHYQSFDETAAQFVDLGTSLYCAENTNTVDVLGQNNAITSILLKAKIYQATSDDAVPTVGALDLVRYNGVLYKNDHFKDYVLTILNTQAKHDLYYELTPATGTEGAVYGKLDKTHIELVEVDGSGSKVNLALTETLPPLYKKTAEGYVALADEELASAKETFNASLKAAVEAGNAEGYKGGDMFYVIRVKHADDADNVLDEGDYGIVRNHAYKVNVNSLKKLGYAIFDETVPTPVDGGDEPDNYYVGATIHVLAWKIVNQDVEL